MWVIGGYNSGGDLKDVWYTTTLAITSITPATADNRNSITGVIINGSEFDATTSVKLTKGQTDIDATNEGWDPATTNITCDFPIEGVAIGDWDVTVTNPAPDGRTYTLPNGFHITALAPTLSGTTPVSPNTGNNRGPIDVTISGDNFLPGATVKLTKGVQTLTANPVNRDSWNTITCTLPITEAALGDWDVVVTNPDNTPVTLQNGFTVTALPPIVTSIVPNTGVNTSSVGVTISGDNFLQGVAVNLTRAGLANITANPLTRVSWNMITGFLPITGAATGPWNVTVTNPDGQYDNLTTFTVMAPPPKVTGVTPEMYWNISSIHVTIAGSGFNGGATVNLTKAGQANITAVNPTITATSIGCDLPITGRVTGYWNVTVTNTDGQFDNLTTFQVLAAPYPVIDLTQTSPAQGENTGSVTMTIIGSYFVNGATVQLTKFGQTPISAPNVNVVSSTKITCTLNLRGATVADDWRLWVTNPDGQSNSQNNLFQFAVIAAKGVISSSGGGSSSSNVPAPAQYQPASNPAPSTVDTGKSAPLSTNADGVTTQETTLQSNDNFATVSIPAGIVAKDSIAGTPLTSVTIVALSESARPADTPGSVFTFAERAYELGPEGATFSPAITLSFTVNGPPEGQTYTIRMFDHATNTWLALPTTYHPESNTVTTEVSHFCCFALFAQATVPTVMATVTASQAQPVPSPTKGTGTFILEGMVLWGVSQVRQNLLVVAAIIILVVGILLYGRKRGRDRRKREYFRLTDQP